MAHPFMWLSRSARRRAFVAMTALTFVLMAVMAALDAPLKTDDAPLGIVSFELAGTLPKARAILASWEGRGEIYAALGLGLDYVFLLAYSLSIALGCTLLASRQEGRRAGLARAGFILAWAQLGAAALDAVENYALIRLLLGSADGGWAALAWGCAVPKFGAVLLGLLYLIVAGAFALRSSGSKTSGRLPGSS
jgi:hypothetical protein